MFSDMAFVLKRELCYRRGFSRYHTFIIVSRRVSLKCDCNIGREFPTPKGGTITIKGLSDKKVGGKKSYLVYCNICSKDSELFPTLHSSLSNLNKGAVPCGCSNVPKWTSLQYKIMLSRLGSKLGYEWACEDNNITSKSKLTLTCKRHDLVWSSTRVGQFIKNSVRCKLCTIERNKNKPLDSLNKDLHDKGCIGRDDIVTRNLTKQDHKGYYSFVDLHCKVCQNDEYVLNGLCDGVFSTHIHSLYKNHKPCRCSKSFIWTKSQRTYQIENICKENGGEFIGWEDGYKGSFTTIKCSCYRGHIFNKTVNELVNNKSWCKICAQQESSCYGYYPNRSEEKDYLYLLDFGEVEKVGRSFNIHTRITQLNSISKLKGNLLLSFTGTHKDVYLAEQETLDYIRSTHFAANCLWTTEAYLPKFRKSVIAFVYNILEKYNLKEVVFE